MYIVYIHLSLCIDYDVPYHCNGVINKYLKLPLNYSIIDDVLRIIHFNTYANNFFKHLIDLFRQKNTLWFILVSLF